MTIQHASIDDPLIHEPKGASTAAAGTIYVADGAGSGAWTPQVAAPSNVVLVESAADLPDPIAGTISLADNTLYQFSGIVDIGTDRLVMGANTLLSGLSRFTDGITYSGTSPMITAITTHSFREIQFTCPNSAFLSLSGTGVETALYTNSFVVECSSVGTITDWGATVFRSFSVIEATNVTNGRLLFAGTNTSLNMDNSLWTTFTAGSMLDLGSATFDRVQIEAGNRFVTSPGVTALNAGASNANLTASGRGIVSSTIFNGAGSAIGGGITVFDTRWTFSNNAGLRDTSCEAGYSVVGNATATTISTISTPVQVEFDGNASSYLDHRFTINSDGEVTYDGVEDVSKAVVFTTFSDVSAGSNKVFNFYIAKNGTIDTNSVSTRSYDAADPGSQVIQIIMDLSNGDVISLWTENTTDTSNITVENSTFLVR